MPPSESTAALAECHAAGTTGVFLLSEHAAQRAEEREYRRADIRNALRSATEATPQDDGTWRVTGGATEDGDPVTLIVSFLRGVLIITLYEGA